MRRAFSNPRLETIHATAPRQNRSNFRVCAKQCRQQVVRHWMPPPGSGWLRWPQFLWLAMQ